MDDPAAQIRNTTVVIIHDHCGMGVLEYMVTTQIRYAIYSFWGTIQTEKFQNSSMIAQRAVSRNIARLQYRTTTIQQEDF